MRTKRVTGRIILSIILVLMLLSFFGCGRPKVQPQPDELVRLWDEPSSLDPHLARDVDSSVILVEIFGGLVTMDPDLKIVPDLAASWIVSPDGRTYTFSLRRDARFHNGKQVTADDVKWSLERVADPKTQSTTVDTYLGDIIGVREKLRGEVGEVAGIKVIDAYTIAITIDAPKTYFISKLTYPTAFVLDRENVESSPLWFKTANGTGPFKLKEYVAGNRIVLEANPRYHLGSPLLKKIRFLLSGGTPMVMYENNEIFITGVELADLRRLRDPNSPLKEELHRGPPGFQLAYLGMNINMPPFDDVKVRQALAHAIPREDIASKILENLVVPAYGILPPGFPGYNPDVEGLRYDIEKAKKLLAESKYGADLSNLPPITLTVPGSLGAIVGFDLQAILATWRDALGINVELRQMEFATFLSQLNAYRLQMYALGWVADYPDPQNFLDLLFHSRSLNNETGYANSEVDRLLEAARAERDEQNRFVLYRQAEEIISNEVPVIPLWHSGEGYVLIKPFVKDYLLLPLVVPKYRYTSIVEQ